jgi:predicted acetyltransferase
VVVWYAWPVADGDVEIPTEEDWPELFAVDARGFGFSYGAEEIEAIRRTFDVERFRVIRDRGAIVAMAATIGLDVTLPGGGTLPMGGVTWVSVAATHRRRGSLRRLMDACHDDIDARQEPLATLTASEGGIYERFGYGTASWFRSVDVFTRTARWGGPTDIGEVWYLTDSERASHVATQWERARRLVVGEVDRSEAVTAMLLDAGSRPMGDQTRVHHLGHADGYAAYRQRAEWSTGFPAHHVTVDEVVASTPEAHAALWRTLVELDLVDRITRRRFPMDDPLPYLLSNQRAVQTTSIKDGIWVNVRDVARCFGARTYATEDALVVEVVDERGDARRWRIEGSPDGAAVRSVRSRPDLTMSRAALGALLYGGVRPSALARGGRLTAASERALARADLFFPGERPPNCQTPY